MIATCQRVRDLAPGFVLGALEPDEMIAVREHLEECDKPHPEITELGGVVPYLAQVVEPVEPPESLKTAIVAAARTELAERHRRDKAAERLVAALGAGSGGRTRAVLRPEPSPAASSEIEPAVEPHAVPAPGRSETAAPLVSLDSVRARRNRILGIVVGIAAAVALLVGGVAYADLQNRYDTAKKQNDAAASIYYGGPNDKLPIGLSSPTGGKAYGVGRVRANGHLSLALMNLPETSGNDVYEIWLVADNGTATPGGFTNGGSLAQLDIGSPAVGTAAQVVVTLEHGRDAKTPSQPPILSGRLGN